MDEADLEVLMSYWDEEPYDPALLAHWTLEETEGFIAHDSTGTNDGTVVGVPTWQPDGGNVDRALECGGTTLVTTSRVLSPSEGPFSVLAWVKGGAPGQAIVSQRDSADWLLADPASGALMTDVKRGPRDSVLSSQAVITDGDWHHIGFTWDGSSRSLYVDNILGAEDTQAGLAEGQGGRNIGADKNLTAGTFFTGLIGDLRIYNRAVRP